MALWHMWPNGICIREKVNEHHETIPSLQQHGLNITEELLKDDRNLKDYINLNVNGIWTGSRNDIKHDLIHY